MFGTVSRFQLSSCYFEVKLKNCRTFSTTGSKTAQDHDTNTTIVYSFCSVLELKSLYSSKHPNSYFCGQRTQSLPHLTTKLYQKEFDLSVWAAAVKLEGINCGAEDSFLVITLLVQDIVKLTSLCTVMLVFQYFPDHAGLSLHEEFHLEKRKFKENIKSPNLP